MRLEINFYFMKKILYMAMSANGMIAKHNDDTSWKLSICHPVNCSYTTKLFHK